MSYGADQTERYRSVAVFVDKILKGTKPADLPVEQPMKFEFIINLKAAKQIGLTIPPNVLVRADKVIKVKISRERNRVNDRRWFSYKSGYNARFKNILAGRICQ